MKLNAAKMDKGCLDRGSVGDFRRHEISRATQSYMSNMSKEFPANGNACLVKCEFNARMWQGKTSKEKAMDICVHLTGGYTIFCGEFDSF